MMPGLVLHDVDPNLLQRLRDLASRSGRTVEQEAKLMLEESIGLSDLAACSDPTRPLEASGVRVGSGPAARTPAAGPRKRAAEAARRIKESHGRKFSDSADLIREDRDH
jgi:hypothetical protein